MSKTTFIGILGGLAAGLSVIAVAILIQDPCVSAVVAWLALAGVLLITLAATILPAKNTYLSVAKCVLGFMVAFVLLELIVTRGTSGYSCLAEWFAWR